MTEISFPVSFSELSPENQAAKFGFRVECVWDPSEFTPQEIADKAEEISAMYIDYQECSFELTQEAIDTMYSLIKGFEQLNDQSRELVTTLLLEKTAYLMDFIFQKIQKGGDAVSDTKFDQNFKNGVRIVFYFFCCATAHIETICGRTPTAADAAAKQAAKAKGKKTKKAAASSEDEDFAWSHVRIIFLETMKRLLTVPPSLLWGMGIVQENFLSVAWGYAVKLLEERPLGIVGTGTAEGAARTICKDIVINAAAHFSSADISGSYSNLTSALLEGINRAEHMSTYSAEICGKCSALLTGEFLKEISGMEFNSQSASAGMKNVGLFIENLVKFNSQMMITNLPIILCQLDAGAHQIRSSLISALGNIVLKVDSQIKCDGGAATEKKNEERESGVLENDENEHKHDHEHEHDSNDEENADADENSPRATDNQKEMLPRVRDNIMDMIVERTHDISPYTRATVLKVWHLLLSNDAIPVRRFTSIAELAYDRLHDKAAAVRKGAIALLTVLLERNPFGSTLDHLAFMQQKLVLEGKMNEKLELMKAAYVIAQAQVNDEVDDGASAERESEIGTGDSTDRERGEYNEGTPEVPATTENSSNENEKVTESVEGETDQTRSHTADVNTGDEFNLDAFKLLPEVQEDTDIMALQRGLDYCEASLEMIRIIVQASPKVSDMLKSKSSLEVIEALKFIACSVNFNVRGSLKNFRCALPLVFHTEESIRTACIACFRQVFLVTGDSEANGATAASLPPAEVARSLCHLLQTFGASERTCVEKILKELFTSGEMDQNIAIELWKIVTEAKIDTSDAFAASHRKTGNVGAALSILTIVARSLDESNTSEAKFSLAIQNGLSQDIFATLDFSAMKATAMFLQECAPFRAVDVISSTEASAPKRALFETATKKLVGVILGGMCEDNDEFTRAWFPACEEAIHALYHFHPSADLVLSTVISSMYASFAMPRGDLEGSSESILCSNARLSRFLFVLGQTAMSSLVYAGQVSLEAKRLVIQAAKDENEKMNTNGSAQSAEDDADMAAAIDADHENCFHQTMEKSLVLSNLLGRFHPIIALVVANQSGKFSNTLVREASTLALSKYMCVSSILCEKYLPLLFTSLVNEKVEACRTTILLAFGDLMLRFPNSLEAWTPLMYARLNDEKVVVRYNALMVLTHLILNDMVKVKGQVAHVVMCLTDAEPKIRDMAHVFFIKLSERSNNPVYNLLGDIIGIISREKQSTGEGIVQVASLSADSLNYPTRELNAREFQATMHFLLSFVKKDKQADSMLERLLVRLSGAQSLRQRRSLAFCISELTVTEKGVKKMAEMIRSIKDSLYDEEVFEYILKSVQCAKKESSKGNAEEKRIAEELEGTLMAIRRDARGEEASTDANHESSENVPNAVTDTDAFSLRDTSKPAAKSKSKTKAAKTPVKRKPSRKAKKIAESESEDNDEEDEAEFGEEIATKPVRSRRRALEELN